MLLTGRHAIFGKNQFKIREGNDFVNDRSLEDRLCPGLAVAGGFAESLSPVGKTDSSLADG
ncbi:MAG: hypothetical protein ACKO5E_17950 [bacterium]